MKLVVCGVAGRMGRAILDLLYQEKDLTLSAGLERQGHPAVGQNAGRLIGMELWGGVIHDQIKKGILDGDVVVDFTYPEETLKTLQEAVAYKKPMVIGTTGFSPKEEEKIVRSSKKIPIVFSPNMSVGVNVIFKLIADAARVLGDAYDVEIVEMHHRQKKDAPSGTALRMGEAIASARGTTLSKVGRFSREGAVGARPFGEIGIQSLRGGEVIGEHTIIFAGQGEQIQIAHRAQSRQNFARGAILAARWVVRQPPGLYDMMDVLDLQ